MERIAYLVVDGRKVLKIEGKHERNSEEKSEDVNNCVGVGGSEVLGPLVAHHTLGHDVLESCGLVGRGGSNQRSPGEREFLKRGETHTTNDGEEGEVHDRVVDLFEEERVRRGRKDGLSSLHDLAEGHGSGAEGEDGEGMRERGEETYGGELST